MNVTSEKNHPNSMEELGWQVLRQVEDPEIRGVSIVDLGMVRGLRIHSGKVEVDLAPTFIGCPALTKIEDDVRDALQGLDGIHEVNVYTVYAPPWTPEDITAQGKQACQRLGISLARVADKSGYKTLSSPCPYCGGSDVELQSLFGPSLCRSMFYCNECHQPFEAVKPL